MKFKNIVCDEVATIAPCDSQGDDTLFESYRRRNVTADELMGRKAPAQAKSVGTQPTPKRVRRTKPLRVTSKRPVGQPLAAHAA